MDWNHVISDPVLSELPYKIELNEWGNLEMSPASNDHGMLQTEIALVLRQLAEDGRSFVECSIQTSKNVKVADVVWCSDSFLLKNRGQTPFTESPELVIEVASPSNKVAELVEKRSLYFGAGAEEVWICEEGGEMLFYSKAGKLAVSSLFPSFPDKIVA